MSETPERFDPPGDGPPAIDPAEHPVMVLHMPIVIALDAEAAANRYAAHIAECEEAERAGLTLDEAKIDFAEWAVEFAVSWISDGPILGADLDYDYIAAMDRGREALELWRAGHPHTKSVWTERLAGALGPLVESEEPA